MIVQSGFIKLSTKGLNDIHDITPQVNSFVNDNGFSDGQLLIAINGSTAALSTVEYEPGLVKDIPEMLAEIAPMDKSYHHDEAWHDGNGYAHLRSTLIGTSYIVPIINGQLVLGTWQQIIFIDFDNRPRQREITLQFVGKK
jgi:secondary thiamine-phosphate synthase enzyme